MENENNNYSFTPIMEDNSVNEIKDDFFGGSSSEPSTPPTNEVPPILEVPEIKEEKTPVAPSDVETMVNDAVAPESTVNQNTVNSPEPTPVTEPEHNVEEVKQEQIPESSVSNEEVTIAPEPITEVNPVPVDEAPSEPVEVKIPEGLDGEPKEVAPVEETIADSTPQVEMPVEPVNTPESTTPASETVTSPEAQSESPKKGKSIFGFFKKDVQTVDNSNPNPSVETPSELDPFNNFVTDVPESEPVPAVPAEESIVENHEATPEVSLPTIEEPTTVEETPVIEEKKEEPEEESLPSVDEPNIPEPVFEPITKEDNDMPKFTDVEDKYEPVKEPEPIVKEVVIEKEKVVLGKKCPNCGEVTAETFCPNCGFLVE